MRKTNFYLLGLLVLIVFTNYQCNCPECPQESNIVIDNVDTARFMIVTDDADTAYVSFPVPKVQKLDSLFTYSIVIDNVDTAKMRIVTDDADAARLIVNPKVRNNNEQMQQKQ